jgi:hypothetical protein
MFEYQSEMKSRGEKFTPAMVFKNLNDEVKKRYPLATKNIETPITFSPINGSYRYAKPNGDPQFISNMYEFYPEDTI